jgi:hypothetical protein
MLSSIHPLGERARNNRWWVTATAFTLGASAAGGVVGGSLGWGGGLILGDASLGLRLGLTALVFVVAGVLDLVRISPWGPTRQVNEHWIGHYRGWVYGGAFGVELGAGVATYVVTWGVYATLAAEVLTASWLQGAVVGAIFGLGRSMALLLAVRIDRPSRLTAFHRRMAQLGPLLRRTSAAATVGLGTLGALVLVL